MSLRRKSSCRSTRQHTLNQIAEVLSSLKHDPSEADLRLWREYGIDEQYLPKEGETVGVRYHLTSAEPRTWTLVDEQGNRFRRQHQGRELLIEAVMNAYREATGQELLDRPYSVSSKAYLTVIPRHRTGAGETNLPFYGCVDIGDPHCDLKYLALLAGDTVIVSRREPKATMSSLP